MQLPNNKWGTLLAPQLELPYFQQLRSFIIAEYDKHTVYPKKEHIFEALKLTDFDDVKVVILGQDPYHGPNQAHGLAFSVQPNIPLPPSLRNIFKELEQDLNITLATTHGDLTGWAKQGVLLLNTVLTVRAGEANSHKHKGWENFTDEIIKLLGEREKPIVFMLWGKPAQAKRKWIGKHHIVLESVHPSPLSAYRGFFNSKPFSHINNGLAQLDEQAINWTALL